MVDVPSSSRLGRSGERSLRLLSLGESALVIVTFYFQNGSVGIISTRALDLEVLDNGAALSLRYSLISRGSRRLCAP
jgi:hypothetical protein